MSPVSTKPSESSALPPEFSHTALQELVRKGRTTGSLTGEQVAEALRAADVTASRGRVVLRALGEQGITVAMGPAGSGDAAATTRTTKKASASASTATGKTAAAAKATAANGASRGTAANGSTAARATSAKTAPAKTTANTRTSALTELRFLIIKLNSDPNGI